MGVMPGYVQTLLLLVLLPVILAMCGSGYETMMVGQGESAVFKTDKIRFMEIHANFSRGHFFKLSGEINCSIYILDLENAKASSRCERINGSLADLNVTLQSFGNLSSLAVTLPNITQEAYTDVFRLQLLAYYWWEICWKLYVLAPSKMAVITNNYLVESGTGIKLTDFPRLIWPHNTTEDWIFEGRFYNTTLDIDTEFSGKNLTYVVTDGIDTNTTATINFTLLVLHTASPRYMSGILVVAEGKLFNSASLPHLSEEDAAHVGVTESWVFRGTTYPSFNMTAFPDMSNNVLLYRLTDKDGNMVEKSYTVLVMTSTITRHTNDVYLAREGSLVCVTDLPHLLPGDIEAMNVTEQWYLNGNDTKHRCLLVNRGVERPVLTYVISDSSMKSIRYDYTIAAAYGPSPNVTFEHGKSVYIVSERDTIPTIRCEVECFPPCNIVWTKMGEKLSETNTLSLGRATTDTTGEYICTAWNNITNEVATKSLFVHTKGNAGVFVLKYILIGLVVVLSLFCMVMVILMCRIRKQRDTRTIDGEREHCTSEVPTYMELSRSATEHPENHYSAYDTGDPECVQTESTASEIQTCMDTHVLALDESPENYYIAI